MNTNKHDQTKNFSDIRLFLLSLIPLISSSLNLSLFPKALSYFNKYVSISATIPLIIPFILRNFTNLSIDFDYKMLTISNMLIISKFIYNAFTCDNYKILIMKMTSNEDIYFYLPYLLSIIFDVFLATSKERTIAISYKLLSALALMILLINNNSGHYDILSYLVFVLPTFIFFCNINKKQIFVMVLTVIVYYTILFDVCLWYWSQEITKTNATIVTQILDKVRSYVPFL